MIYSRTERIRKGSELLFFCQNDTIQTVKKHEKLSGGNNP